MKEFCEQIAEILDVAEVKESDVLADFAEWDSLVRALNHRPA